jgi:hypothetical protein
MKLKELKQSIDFYISRNQNNEEKEVVVRLDQVSIGFSASTQV